MDARITGRRASSTSAPSAGSRRPRRVSRRPSRTPTAPLSRWPRRWRARTWRRVKADTDVETAQANVTLSEARAEAGGKPEEGRHRNRHRNHPRQGATGQRPAAPAGGAERPPQRAPAAAARHGPAARYRTGTDRQSAVPAGGRRDLGAGQGAGAQAAAGPTKRSRTAKPTRGSRPAPPSWSGCPRSRRSAITAPSARASTTPCPPAPTASR